MYNIQFNNQHNQSFDICHIGYCWEEGGEEVYNVAGDD